MAEITRDLLLERRAELELQEREALANLNAIAGARQVITHLLAVLDEEAPEAVPAEAPAPEDPT